MTESFLHYLWQFQYFKKENLATTDGEQIQVFKPGIRNSNSGPDFSEAKIKIGALEWRGSVEIHLKASGWNDHHHSADPAYENVVLHVVWENDKPILRTDGSAMPTFELKSRVDLNLWDRYKNLVSSVETIPCTSGWTRVSDLIKLSMLDKAVVQRLESKATIVQEVLIQNKHDWEETTYKLLCRNFGFKVNAEPMQQLAHLLPYKILLKHPQQMEALLFGQSGFLEKVKDDEYTSLQKREYALLSKKYNLVDKKMNEVQWRFLRLRPANFPTVRLSQLAALLSTHRNLFSRIIEIRSYQEMAKLLEVDQSEYWQHHYRPGKKSRTLVPSIGVSSIENVVINTIVPLLVAYGKHQDDQSFIDRAVKILQDIPAEKNKIIRVWSTFYRVNSAFDSQGLIELYNNFCMKRRCLECSVGLDIIKS